MPAVGDSLADDASLGSVPGNQSRPPIMLSPFRHSTLTFAAFSASAAYVKLDQDGIHKCQGEKNTETDSQVDEHNNNIRTRALWPATERRLLPVVSLAAILHDSTTDRLYRRLAVRSWVLSFFKRAFSYE